MEFIDRNKQPQGNDSKQNKAAATSVQKPVVGETDAPVLTAKEQKRMEKYRKIAEKTVRCPYCQKEFQVKEMLFRVAEETDRLLPKLEEEKRKLEAELTALETENLLENGDSSTRTEDVKRRLNELKAKLKKAEPLMSGEKNKLIKLWESKGWTANSSALREFSDGYVEILKPADSKDVLEGTAVADVQYRLLPPVTEQDIDPSGKIGDLNQLAKDGYLEFVTDSQGNMTKKRVCPHCHCVLPTYYGRYKTVSIACIGIRGSGKTVILSKFIDSANRLLDDKLHISMNLSRAAVKFVENKKVAEGEKLPAPTTSENFKPPIITEIKKGRKYYTCIFYDIAGENCVDDEAVATLGSFIQNADALMMLISPEQIRNITVPRQAPQAEEEGDFNPENYDILDVFKTVARVYTDNQVRNNDEKCTAKMAVIISQSDRLIHDATYMKDGEEKRLSEDNELGHLDRDIRYGRGFMIKAHIDMEGDIKHILSGGRLEEEVKALYEHAEIFAVSALGKNPIMVDGVQYPPNQIKPLRLEEPFVWLFSQVGILPIDSSGLGLSDRAKIFFGEVFKGLKNRWKSNN